MSITLAELASAAVGTQSRRAAKVSFYSLPVEEARDSVKIKDGNRKPAEDGSQKLTVVIGKHTLPLDFIKAGTSRIAVSADQVEGYTAALQEAINDGSFDEVIAKAQDLARIQAEKAAANPVKRAPKAVEAAEDTAGLDLDSLEVEEVSDEL